MQQFSITVVDSLKPEGSVIQHQEIAAAVTVLVDKAVETLTKEYNASEYLSSVSQSVAAIESGLLIVVHVTMTKFR
jgi:hypothetical protein